MEPRTPHAGVGLVELFLGSTVLAVAVLGVVSGVMTGLKYAIDCQDASMANEEARQVVEDFRDEANADFDGALDLYNNKLTKGAKKRQVISRIILDETRFDPPSDLNADGDFDDTKLEPCEVEACYIETKVVWGRGKSMSLVTLVERPARVSRNNARRAQRRSRDADSGGVPEVDSTEAAANAGPPK